MSECFVGVCSWTHVMWDSTHKIGVPHRHEWFLITSRHLITYKTRKEQETNKSAPRVKVCI